MKKIYIIVRAISFENGVGGLERSAYDHIIELHKLGYEILLISPAENIVGKLPTYITICNVALPKIPVISLFGLEYYIWCKNVAGYIRSNVSSKSLLHFHGASVGVLSFLNKNDLYRYKTVCNPHGMEEFTFGKIRSEINRVFIKKLAQKANLAQAVIATDNQLISKVQENIKVKPEKIFVIPNGVNIERLHSLVDVKEIDNMTVRDSLIIVSLGRIEFNKGYDLLAQAIYDINTSTQIKIKWIHLGRGSRKKEIESIMLMDKRNKFEILEFASDIEVNTFLSICDIFVQPSRFEGSSLTTLEAMAHGCLVVGTKVGGIPDKIINNQTGILVENVNAESIKNALLTAVALDEHLKNNIKEMAKKFVEENFDVRKLAVKYDQLYSTL